MRYNDPTLRDMLAGQYALGALQGAARARFERLMRRDAALRKLVHDWEDRLSPLAAQTAPVKPPAHVFAAIQRRIEGATESSSDTPSPLALSREGRGGVGSLPRLIDRLGFWRAFSAVGAAAVVVLALATTFFMLRPPAALTPSYVAILSDNAAQPALVVTAYKGPWRLNVETLAQPALPPGKVLQVWAIEKDTGVVRPLVALASGRAQQMALTETHWKLVRTAHALAVNIEPVGTTPTAPTTPVLYSGRCLNLKGV